MLVEIRNKSRLDEFVASLPHSPFQQSWEWGEFQKAAGFNIKRWGMEEGNKLVSVATIVENDLGMGMKYWYCPKGIVVHETVVANQGKYERVLNDTLVELGNMGRREGIVHLRFEPLCAIHDSLIKIQKTISVQPSLTIVLDLSKTEEELLAAMHQKTRYNIRLAEKKGVEIMEAGFEKFEEFWNLMAQTKDRDAFRLHGKEYYKKMLDNGRHAMDDGQSLSIKLYFAIHQNKYLATSIVSFFGDTVTYLHGGSSDQDRNMMAPYILQWNTIQRAKELGFRYYDFYGVDEIKWPGVTRFKRGFSGSEISSPGTYDAVFSPYKYGIYKLARRIRRLA